MIITLIRHGESTANKNAVHAGWAQVPLSQNGISQAKGLALKLAGKKFDKIYSSDLIRAIQTLENAIPNCEFEQSPLLREHNVGKLAGKGREDCKKEYGKLYETSKARRDFTPFGGENENDLINRASEFYKSLSNKDYENVAIFTHEGFIRATLEITLNTTILPKTVSFPNCIVCSFELNEGKLKLLTWNE